MRSEEELKNFLEKCHSVSGFGMSNGPCPLETNEKKECVKYCIYAETEIEAMKLRENMSQEDIDEAKKECCDNWDKHLGCCAECSFPSVIEWVLGKDKNPTDNGQNRLINLIKEANES